MRKDLTIIYYTANVENQRFEGKIIRSLVHNSRGIPIISVSWQPMNLGTNICVGVKEHTSGQNAFRQLLIGMKAATTKYVCPAEADYLYPREYFQFVPTSDDCAWVAKPLWVAFNQRGLARYYAYKQRGSEASMMINREFAIDVFEKMLSKLPEWGPQNPDGIALPYLFKMIPVERFIMEIPAITFKTDNNMHRKTPHMVESKTRELPYWGEVHDLIRRYS